MAEVQDFNIADASNTARWPEGMAYAGVNDAGRADEGILARWYKDTNASLTSSGAANAYAVTSNRTMAALFDNLLIAWTANHTNTGAATLALNGLTAKNIKRPNGDALVAGDIVSGQAVIVVYKSSPDEWRLLSPGAFGASDTLAGAMAFATQALMEAAASLVTAVTPGRQHFHPGHPKAWGRVQSDGTLVSGSFNVASVVRNSAGVYTVTLTTALANTNYAVIGSQAFFNNVRVFELASITSASVFVVNIRTVDVSLQDSGFSFMVLGDH